MMDERFAFGKNWWRFLGTLDERHIEEAVHGLQALLETQDLEGRTFLDVGSRSGIHSLAAHRMRAERVFSFDYDLDSVRCTEELKRRAGDPEAWAVVRGSVLDVDFMENLPQFDIVYSWGVLHHTGSMWDAIKIASGRCRKGAMFVIGIYNRKGRISDVMKLIKRTYVRSNLVGRSLIKWSYFLASSAVSFTKGNNTFSQVRNYRTRGMSYWIDLEDWVGGYPFECATPEEVVSFVTPLGFELIRSRVGTSFAAVNEFVFHRIA
jgi:SAM-dependent methyltransferase